MRLSITRRAPALLVATAMATGAVPAAGSERTIRSFLDTSLAIQRESGWLDERTRHWATSTEGLR
jgi:hypothetical protein